MKLKHFTLLILTYWLFAVPLSADAPVDAPAHPLDLYLNEMDEMGRTLSGWRGDSLGGGSWFYGAYAMLLLNNNGRGENVPFQGLEDAVPELWSDVKYLSPRDLVELAGGALSNGDLMSITKDQIFEELKTEERFIQIVAGFGYLRMLQGTIGDSLFHHVVNDAIQASKHPVAITGELINSMAHHCCEALALQYEQALKSSSWSDVHLKKVAARSDSLELTIEHLGDWSFPVDVLVIGRDGDSTHYTYGLDQKSPLMIPKKVLDKVVLDPDRILVEYYRYNNQWPRLRDRVFIQPFAALPNWSEYRITVNPTYWKDWDQDTRLGIKFTSGLGVDLWPAYPSDYRHRTTMEIFGHNPYDQPRSWGGRISYGHPLKLHKRLFSNVNVHSYDDWTGVSVGVVRYVGKQTFLIQGPLLTYQRLSLKMEFDRYADAQVWQDQQRIQILKGAYSGLFLTNTGDRFYFLLRAASGDGPTGAFSIFKAQSDLTGVFWGWLVGGIRTVAGFQSTSTPSPYQFSSQYAWQDNLAAIPTFRGQVKLQNNTNEYLGLSVSGGYWLTGFQLKAFTSSMIVDMNALGWDQVVPRYAAGFGFEHRSFFTAGLYFPIWQSHPLEGEEPWAWRYQTRFTWNL